MVGAHFFDPWEFGSELVYTIVAVLFCFLIYFKTKELFDLTKYAGIKYFRDAFLFFGVSYAIRFLFELVLFSKVAFDFILPRTMFAPLFILPLGYFSTMGIFYLLFSLLWKRGQMHKWIWTGHGIAVVLSLISFFTRSHFILLFLQAGLLFLTIVLTFFWYRNEKKISSVRLLYFLILFFWLINLLIIERERFFLLGVKLFFQVFSLGVLIMVYYKIVKWVK